MLGGRACPASGGVFLSPPQIGHSMAYRRTERVRLRLEARHVAIMAAARALASEHGMAAVQIAPVADRAGIAAGTVYRYFPAKASLVQALVDAMAETEIAAIRLAADAAPGPLSALAAALLTLSARALRQRRLAWALIAEPVDADVDVARLAFRRAVAGEIEGRIGRAAPHLPDQDVAMSAAAIVGALLEGLLGPLAPVCADIARERETAQVLALLALRAVGIADARARGLVAQTPWPDMHDAAAEAPQAAGGVAAARPI